MKKGYSVFIILSLLLSILGGCDAKTDEIDYSSTASTSSTQNINESVATNVIRSEDEMFTNRDSEIDYNPNNCVVINLNDSGSTSSSDSVMISGSTVTITEEDTYLISGTLSDGMLIVDTNDSAKLQIVLNGANITSSTSAALYILNADKVFVTLAEGSENSLVNGGTFEAIDDNNIDGAIYSKEDLTFNGNGSLTVTSPAGHGIVCKDDLVFTSGTYTISSASHGLDVNDSVRIANASLTVEAGKDGIQVENTDDAELGFLYISSGTVNIGAEGDGISATSNIQIVDGTIQILAGGGYENGTAHSSSSYGDFRGGMGGMGGFGGKGSKGNPQFSPTPTSSSDTTGDSTSMKGIKSDGTISVSDGTISIDSADDAIHAAEDVIVGGGTWSIYSGDDGIHSDKDLTVTDCSMTISEAYEGLEAVSIFIKGGTLWMNCSDDGLNAAGGTDSSGNSNRDNMFGAMGGGPMSRDYGNIEISGGNLTIYSGGDAIDSNGDFTMTGGYVYGTNPKSGDVSILDSQNSPIINGGTYIGLGVDTMMAETFSASSSQGVIACTCGNIPAESQLVITDSKGNVVLETTNEYTTAIIIISTPDIQKGESYNIAFGSVSGTVEAS